MKVQETDSVPLPSSPSAPAAKPQTQPSPVADKTSSSLAEAVDLAKNNIAVDRLARTQQLASQIKSGTYQPNPQLIADQILDEAEVDAELEAQG